MAVGTKCFFLNFETISEPDPRVREIIFSEVWSMLRVKRDIEKEVALAKSFPKRVDGKWTKQQLFHFFCWANIILFAEITCYTCPRGAESNSMCNREAIDLPCHPGLAFCMNQHLFQYQNQKQKETASQLQPKTTLSVKKICANKKDCVNLSGCTTFHNSTKVSLFTGKWNNCCFFTFRQPAMHLKSGSALY
jgi:hypothetical protein